MLYRLAINVMLLSLPPPLPKSAPSTPLYWYHREIAARLAQGSPQDDELFNINGLEQINEDDENSQSDGPTPTVFFLPDGHSLSPAPDPPIVIRNIEIAETPPACALQANRLELSVDSSSDFNDIDSPGTGRPGSIDSDNIDNAPPLAARNDLLCTGRSGSIDSDNIEIDALPPRNQRDATLTSSSSP